MGFEHPWTLWGLLIATLPIIIHLIQRRRARVLPFAAIEFLLVGDARRARRLHLQQWLVLALRVGLLAALALALSKPYLTDTESPVVAAGEPTAVVLLLDDSASMAAEDEEGASSFEKMIDAARERIDAGGPLARFGVVTTGRPARRLTPSLTNDRAALAGALDGLSVSDRGPDTTAAVHEAMALLESAVEDVRILWIGSDGAQHAWSNVGGLELGDGPTSGAPWLEVRSFAGKPVGPNLTLASVTPTAGGGPNGETSFEVTVHNHGAARATTEVRVAVGDLVVAGSLDVPADATESTTLHMALPADVSARGGLAEIRTAGDRLTKDDRLFFELSDSRALRVAVVNGSPRSVPWLDEVFFVRAGLTVREEGTERWTAEHVQVGDLTSGLLVHTDVVILANVGALSASQGLALRHFVDRGGGLFVSVGDQLSPQSNATYGALLALPIRAMKRLHLAKGEKGEAEARGLEIVARDHPILRPFAGDEAHTLTRTRVRSLSLLADINRPGLQVLARWADGAPALVEAPLKEGRVLLLTTSLDRDGSDLVLRTSFVPFLQRAVAYLAGRFDGEGIGPRSIGAPVTVEAPLGEGPLILIGPGGIEREISAGRVCSGQPARCDLGLLDVAGSYVLSRKTDPAQQRGFSLNVDRREGALEAYDVTSLENRLRGDVTQEEEAVASAAPEPRAPVEPGGEPLWPAALLALFGLLLAEGWMALKGT